MELERPGIEVAYEIVEISEHLPRVKEAIPYIPEPLIQLLSKQEDEYLYGLMAGLLALRDLSGEQTLTEAEMTINQFDGIRPAIEMAQTAAGMVSVLETLCYITCKELTLRNEDSLMGETDEQPQG